MFENVEPGRAVNRTTRVSLREVVTGEGPVTVEGTAPALDHLRGPTGTVRAGALLTMADTVGGMCGGLAVLPRWVVSTNLMLNTVPGPHPGPLALRAEVLRAGRTAVVTGVEIRDAGDAVVADGVLTSAVLEPDGGPPAFGRPLVLDAPEGPGTPEPVLEFFGIRARDETAAELDITDRVRNPWGILHGGAIAMLVDEAAARAVGPGAVVVDVVLHFLRPGRTGPAVARATPVGRRPDGELVRVEVVDAGADDRVMSIATCTVRPSVRRSVRPA
jgi:uncharacterized protein (TIGR00369 family)